MSVFEDTKKYCYDHPFIWVLIIIMMVNNVIIPIFRSELLIQVSLSDISDNDNYVKLFLIVEFIQFALQTYVVIPLILSIAYGIKKSFVIDSYAKYDRMTFEEKNNKPMSKFEKILDNASHVIFLMVEWGLLNIIEVVGAIISIMWVFYRKKIIRKRLLGLIPTGDD